MVEGSVFRLACKLMTTNSCSFEIPLFAKLEDRPRLYFWPSYVPNPSVHNKEMGESLNFVAAKRTQDMPVSVAPVVISIAGSEKKEIETRF